MGTSNWLLVITSTWTCGANEFLLLFHLDFAVVVAQMNHRHEQQQQSQ